MLSVFDGKQQVNRRQLLTLFDVGQLRITQGVPQQISQISDAAPIPGLI